MTCFHLSFMGVSEADNSFTHTDVYASGEKAFNFLWPMLLVNGSSPELDIVSDDTNIVLSVNYDYDAVYALGDWVSHVHEICDCVTMTTFNNALTLLSYCR